MKGRERGHSPTTPSIDRIRKRLTATTSYTKRILLLFTRTSGSTGTDIGSMFSFNRYLLPFLAVVESPATTGPMTGVALSSLHKFLLYGFIRKDCPRVKEGITLVARVRVWNMGQIRDQSGIGMWGNWVGTQQASMVLAGGSCFCIHASTVAEVLVLGS